MIFLFDKFKTLKGTVRNRHTISLLYERERNGLYTVAAEIPLKITDKKTVYNYHKKVKDSDFLGHYDREGRFQLHKIASVDIEGSSIYIKGVHLFFDEAKAGAIIQERRFRDSELIDGARVAFESIGWSVVDFDISDTKDYIFYNVSPLEARAILVETFGYEFDYWLDFDGKNIRNKQISVKREMGKDSNKRYNYGHNVLNIKVEQDYSEIYTAVIGRGKGEDLGDDAYGRRIEYTDVVWKTPSNPMNKPKGSRVLHDENATQLFGYHEDGKVSPRTKVEIFEDIEDPRELLQASYEWLKENSVPKAVFSLEVPDGDGLDLGDKVHVIYRDIDLVKHTRVTKVVDDLVSGNRDVEFGDTAYFKTDRRLSGVKAELKRVNGSTSNRITRLKEEFDKRFEDEVQQIHEDFEQALIAAEASVDAARAEMTEEFEAAQREFEEEFNQSVADAKKHAEEAANAKAKEVQDNLDSFAGRHEQIVAELQGNIVGIDGELSETISGISSILGRLTVVDGNISGITDSLTEVEGTLSNTKTQLENQISDARTELEQSISNTKTELENKINTTEEALNKVGEDLGDAKTDLQNQLDEARAELEGLEVGGRNLLIMKDLNLGRHSNTSVDVDNGVISGFGSYYFIFENVNMKADTFYTFSYASSISNRLSFLIRNKETGDIQYIWNAGILPPNEKVTFKVPENVLSETENYHMWVYISGSENIEWQVEKIQLEKGTVATDWTPAPEDTEQKITNINQTITNIEGELSTKVDQTEVDALKGTVTRQGTLLTQTADEVSSKAEKSVVDTLTGRVSNAESSVTQNAEEIAKKLTKSVYDEDKKDTDAKITQWSNTASETAEGLTRVIGRVSETEKGVDTAQTRIEAEAGRIDGLLSRTSNVEGKVSDAELAIKANADGLALRATKTEVEQAIDGIEVGGRNLLLDSDKYNSFEGPGSPTFEMLEEFKGKRNVLKVTNPGAYFIFNPAEKYSMPYEAGQTYNVSFSAMYEGLEPTKKPSIYMNGSSGGYREFNNTMNNESFTRINRTFTQSAPSSNRIHMNFSGYEVVYIVMDFMIVRGNTPMDWSPAPEDFDASISEVTDRVTTAEAEIKVHAGEISQKASQSELNRVTGRVSTAETSITQNANEIARRLVKSDYDSDKQATDAEITKWSNLTTETAEGLEQTINRVSSAEGKLSDAELSIKANADSLKLTATKTEVENAIDGLDVGVRNLVIGSGESISSNDYLVGVYTMSEPWEVEQEYTVVIKGEINEGQVFGIWAAGTATQATRLEYDSEKDVHVSTFTIQRLTVQREKEFRIYNVSSPGAESANVEWVMMVKGNKAPSSHVPAPEDTDAKITKAQADITANAKEIALRATQSDLNSVTGRLSSAESQLSVQSGQISLRATKVDVEQAIDGIEVGGRNLMRNSRLIEHRNHNNHTVLTPSQTGLYTISFDYNIIEENSAITRFLLYSSASGVGSFSGVSPRTSPTQKRVSQTFEVTENMLGKSISLYAGSGSGVSRANKMDFIEIMVEKGNKASDWTPAPEDVDSSISEVANRVSATEASLTVLDDEISSVVGKVDGNTRNIASVVQDTKSITSTVAQIEKDIVTQGSEIDQALDSISNKVWLGDVGGKNLLPQTVFPDDFNAWLPRGTNITRHTTTTRGLTDYLWVNRADGEANRYMAVLSPLLTEEVVEGHEYTIQFKTAHRVNVRELFSYVYLMNEDGTPNQSTPNDSQTVIEIGENDYNGRPIQLHTITIKANFSGRARLLIGTYAINSGAARFYVKEVKIEKGKATAYSRAPEDFLQMSELKITPDYWQLGSTRIDGNSVSSVLRGSPDSIDAIVSEMNLTGNLNVKGQIETISLNAVNANIATIRTNILQSNVITSDHLSVSTSMVNKLFSATARIDQLLTKTHFSNNVKSMSIDAVHADLRKVTSEIMTTNILKSEWINVDNAIVNRIISRQFFTDNAVIKAANIRDLTATDIKGGVLSSLNNSMKFNLINNHLEFNRDATIDFYSTNNALRMFTDSSTSDPRDIIHALGTGMSRSGYGQMFLGGGHYDIDGTVKANDIGFAGLKLSGNSSLVAGSKVTIGSGGNDSQDQFFEFDFTTSLSNRYAYFRPTNTSDNFVIGSSNRWFHSMFTWRLNGLRFYNPSGYIKMGYDNGSGTGASLRFYEDDIWFDRGGTFSLKRTITRANDAYNSINADNGLQAQIRSLASRVYALERK